MNKVVGFPLQDSGVGYYRIIQPLRFLQRQGYVKEVRSLPFQGDFSMQKINLGADPKVKALQWHDKMLMAMAKDSDVLLSTVIWRDDDLTKILDLRKWSGAKWVIDLDDNIYAVSSDNPAYAGLRQVIPKIERSLQLCDGLTVSVPSLKILYSNFCDNIYVNPNGLDFDLPYQGKNLETKQYEGKSWNELANQSKRHRGIRIGWRGAYGHKDDLHLIEPVLWEIKKTYPQVSIVIFSSYKPQFIFNYEHIEWVFLQDFQEKLASLKLDIALVPLIDSSYNRCKSNLNYLEMAALGIPAVISPTENQVNLPALYARTNYEWYEAIASLIENKQKRVELGQQANLYIKEHFNMTNLVKPLAQWLEDLPRRTDLEPERFKNGRSNNF